MTTGSGTLSTQGVLRFFARPDHLQLTSGAGQEMLIGLVAAESLVVQVIDAAGNPFTRGHAVSFSVASGPPNTSISPATVTSDAAGHAATQLTAGDALGAVQVEATAVGLSAAPLAINATVVPGAAAVMVVSAGDGQSATVGTAVGTAPAVLITRRQW